MICTYTFLSSTIRLLLNRLPQKNYRSKMTELALLPLACVLGLIFYPPAHKAFNCIETVCTKVKKAFEFVTRPFSSIIRHVVKITALACGVTSLVAPVFMLRYGWATPDMSTIQPGLRSMITRQVMNYNADLIQDSFDIFIGGMRTLFASM